MQTAEIEITVGNKPVKITFADIARFWAKVNKDGPLPDQSNPHYMGLDRCWIWKGFNGKRGYGQIWMDGTSIGAHRVSLLIANSALDGSNQTLHRCDNPSCVNPDHLFTGTAADNVADKIKKGRLRVACGDKNGSITSPQCLPRGVRHGGAKLTDDLVREMRKLKKEGMSLTQIGDRFGVRFTHVSKIVRREIWAHVTDNEIADPITQEGALARLRNMKPEP